MQKHFGLRLGLLLCCHGLCAAEDAPPPVPIQSEAPCQTDTACENEIWVNVGGFSTHFNSSKGYNENNTGLGVEYRTHADLSYMAGVYYNSYRKNTTYAAANWQPLRVGPWKLGAALGVMNGYPAIERGGTFFAALPLASYEGKSFGLNLGVIPSMAKIDGAVILQLKFRIR